MNFKQAAKIKEKQERIMYNKYRNSFNFEGFDFPVNTTKKEMLLNLFNEHKGEWLNVNLINAAVRSTRAADLIFKLKRDGYNIESRGTADKREHRLNG
jgi:hypothetical protein